MELKEHALIGFILSIGLFPFFGFYSFFILIASVFLDIDHYFYFVVKTKKLSLKKAYQYHKKLKCGQCIFCIFHTIEFLIILGIFSIYSKFFLMIFIGAFVHILMDGFDWFVWFSYYSGRISSIILAPIILKKGKQINNKKNKLGNKCIICKFDKALDIHFIMNYGRVLLCPNHHYLVHKKLISNEELIKLDKIRKHKESK